MRGRAERSRAAAPKSRRSGGRVARCRTAARAGWDLRCLTGDGRRIALSLGYWAVLGSRTRWTPRPSSRAVERSRPPDSTRSNARAALPSSDQVTDDNQTSRNSDPDLDSFAHRFERVTRADLGEPGCGAWHVRPRMGLLGMLAGWWEVKLSSGCP